MDKTIEIIVVAMVAIATAVGLMFMVRGQSDSFLNFAQGETSSAKCDLWKETDPQKYRENCDAATSGESSGTGAGGVDCDKYPNAAGCNGPGGYTPGP